MADVACPVVCQLVWPACWLDTPDGSSSSSTRVVQDVWDVYRNELGVVPDEVVLALKDAASRSSVDDFWTILSRKPMLIAGGLNADPAVIPCLAKGISAGRYVDLALAYSLGGWSCS